jgi:HK97 family phage portal protein
MDNVLQRSAPPKAVTRPRLGFKAALVNWIGQEITPKDGGFWSEWFASGTFLGKAVTVEQALKLATVWACVRLIAETLATLPLALYRRKADGSREAATGHPLYNLLHNQPNADMTAVVFWECVVASLLLWGNAYVEKILGGGQLIALAFLYPAGMDLPKRQGDGSILYRYREDPAKTPRVIPEERMMHIRGFGTDGLLGLSPIAYGANVFGAARETDKAAAETFRDALRSTGLITMDMVLDPAKRKHIREHVQQVSDEGGVFVLEKGSGFQKIGFDPVSAELLASRKWEVEEMCRWYRVDPTLIGHGQATSNWGTGLEQKMLWFLTFSLRHWCVRIEQSVRKDLLTPVERLTYFAEFNMEGLLRADSAARKDFYSAMTQNGIMSRDDCRVKENLPPKGGNAAKLTVQANLVLLEDLGKEAAPPQVPADLPVDGIGKALQAFFQLKEQENAQA